LSDKFCPTAVPVSAAAVGSRMGAFSNISLPGITPGLGPLVFVPTGLKYYFI